MLNQKIGNYLERYGRLNQRAKYGPTLYRSVCTPKYIYNFITSYTYSIG